ncbi:MAG: hypothetical protein JEZ06_13610 [Anaerolineaceae bacterium]|nr:hypothetical protein [Anaerolineaceae bacterium]
MQQSIILSTDSKADLEMVGGKGANLSKLAQAGFPVPRAYFLTTRAFKMFVQENRLQRGIEELISDLDEDDPADLERVSEIIRTRFSAGRIPIEVQSVILEVYEKLGHAPLAVRSSATAEDLPEMSFAGQQDTFLNVIGVENILKAVIDCWSSLWTARAMGYRQRNRIPHSEVSLAVVIQEMVPSEASGVMFTANPLSGSRSELVIDATLGLGEALVSGLVEPDHYVVNLLDGKSLQKTLGSKHLVMHGQALGGVYSEEMDASDHQAVSDTQILELSDIGMRIAYLYAFPQDIEWAISKGKIHVLQSRPITALFPVPEGMPGQPLQAYFSFGAVQGLLGPMTPLGRDAIRYIFAGGASLFGFKETHHSQKTIHEAGGRLWGNLSGIIRNPPGRKMAARAFSAVEPGSIPALKKIIAEVELQSGKGKLSLDTLKRFAKFVFPIARNMIRSIRFPEGKVQGVLREAEGEIRILEERAGAFQGETPDLAHSSELFKQIYFSFIYAVPHIMGKALAGLLPMILMNKISNHFTGSGDKALEITRGMPNNITTEMDLFLWETANLIRKDASTTETMLKTEVQELGQLYLDGNLPQTAQEAIAVFMNKFGMRGVGEIDIGHPRWRENPSPIIQVLQSYLQIEDETLAPDVVFARGAQAAEAAILELETAARKTFAGKIKARLIRKIASIIRELAGLREYPKYHIINRMGIIRESLLASGADLVVQGILVQADDLFFLFSDELDALAKEELPDVKTLVSDRRADYASEERRRQVPRLILSDGRAFYEGLGKEEDGDGIIQGSPVSPGVVEGRVRVVLDPQHADLEPGEIMICPGTDPAWTPLFLAAGGLIMEVGGMMTHGAIVAREYGIPAVVGVDRATERFKTGQKITLDGSTGKIISIQIEAETAVN